jgi:hypothetical protein
MLHVFAYFENGFKTPRLFGVTKMNIKIKACMPQVLLMLVPLMLGACGASGKDNSEIFLKALDDRDKDAAKDAVCGDAHDEIDVLFELIDDSDETELKNLECEEDGDEVTCTYDVDDEDFEVIFEIEDGKVCGGELFDEIRALDDASANESGPNTLPNEVQLPTMAVLPTATPSD